MKLAVLLIAVACSAPTPSTDRFWSYFAAHADQLRAESLEAAMDQLQVAIEPAHHGVLVELAADRDERTLVLTADGDRAMFSDIEALYATRPTVPHWTIVAFRQRDPARPLVAVETLDPNTIRYVADRANGKVDLALFVPNYDQHQAKLVDIALDHVIGELDVATKLGAISITTADHVPPIAKPLAELANDVR